MTNRKNEPQSLLCFDFGTKRIGVATGQAITQSTTPLSTLHSQHGKPDWCEIQALIGEWEPDALVVGIPYHMDGKEQAMTLFAEKFCGQLETRTGLTVYRAEERLSSYAAENTMTDNITLKKFGVDAVAASIILQDWLMREARA
ncbi:MAG: Holliday junction resolvase RuvX [Gammaproteobacteria bacterium]